MGWVLDQGLPSGEQCLAPSGRPATACGLGAMFTKALGGLHPGPRLWTGKLRSEERTHSPESHRNENQGLSLQLGTSRAQCYAASPGLVQRCS